MYTFVKLQHAPRRTKLRRMRKEKKIMVLTARVDDVLGRAIQQLAESDDRTVSNYIERVLREHVAKTTGDQVKPAKRKRDN